MITSSIVDLSSIANFSLLVSMDWALMVRSGCIFSVVQEAQNLFFFFFCPGELGKWNELGLVKPSIQTD